MRTPLEHRSRGSNRAGVATVELAVCLPTLVLLVLASIEACNMIFLSHSLSISTYEGVRAAIPFGATNADVTNKCNQILAARGVAGPTIAISPPDVAVVPRGQRITVTLSAPCAANSSLPAWFFGGKTIHSESSMVKE